MQWYVIIWLFNVCLRVDINDSFEFLIGGEFLRLSLDEHLQEKSLSSVWIDLFNFESCMLNCT